MAGSLRVLLTSPRVAPGLLSRYAWQVLESAEVRYAVDLTSPLVTALGEEGLPVELPPQTAGPLAAPLAAAAAQRDVVWIATEHDPPDLLDDLSTRLADGADEVTLELVVGSHDVPGARLLDAVAVMDRLRSPGGCPWDASQTHATLVPYAREEVEELVEAIESGDLAHVREELGDVLLQVLFHARVAEDAAEGPFDIDDVAAGLVDKLVRRHPHVFADGDASTPEEVEAAWAQIKAAERAGTHPQ